MLHLIWNKDNNATSEDGKELKGVRARLLECYQELYFSAEGNAKEISKNMIQSVPYNISMPPTKLTYA